MARPSLTRTAALIALSALLPAAGGATVDVEVAAAQLVGETSPFFVAHGWEMWQMFGYLEAMANDPRYARAASSLAGSLVRVGGITADWTFYSGFEATESQPQPQPQPLERGALVPRGAAVRAGAAAPFWPTAPSNLTRASFETLLDFFNATGVSLIFDLNELLGRNCSVTHEPCSWDCGEWCEGAWDTSNARAFLQWVHDQKLVGFAPAHASPLVAFELGNELVTHLDPAANLADVRALAALIAEIWADAPAVPPLFAPSTDACSDPSGADYGRRRRRCGRLFVPRVPGRLRHGQRRADEHPAQHELAAQRALHGQRLGAVPRGLERGPAGGGGVGRGEVERQLQRLAHAVCAGERALRHVDEDRVVEGRGQLRGGPRPVARQ